MQLEATLGSWDWNLPKTGGPLLSKVAKVLAMHARPTSSGLRRPIPLLEEREELSLACNVLNTWLNYRL